MGTVLRRAGVSALFLAAPIVALLLSVQIVTVYAWVTTPLMVGREGLYSPGSVLNGHALAPYWATWEFIVWSAPAALVSSAGWLWAWRKQSIQPIAGQHWLNTQSILMLLALAWLAFGVHAGLVELPRTDVFTDILV